MTTIAPAKHKTKNTADKTCHKLHHIAMLITCPQCKAHYQLNTTEQPILLVCHRCDAEFTTLPSKPEQIQIQTAPLMADQSDHEQYEPRIPDQQQQLTTEDKPYPKRNNIRVWPWLLLILMGISGLGIWQHQQQWLAQTWVRNIMLQINMPLKLHNTDWQLLQNQSHSQWITRQDDSKILFIESAIKNVLLGKQIPPTLQLKFYSSPHTDSIQTRKISITEPPNLLTIRRAPFVAPRIDLIPIGAHNKRTFSLIIENVPKHARSFSLSLYHAPKRSLRLDINN